jgi:glucokinase
MTGRGPILAIDIGGTKMAAAVATADGHLIARAQIDTPVGADAEQLWASLAALLDQVLAAAALRPHELAGVGCGCGGPMQWPAGLVSPLNIPGWRRFPLAGRLEDRYGRPVRVHNDAICMAAGEHWHGAGRGHRSMLGIVVSTGVGGGLIVEDRLINGASCNAGHIGHVVVDAENGPPCVCGGRGCLEAIARGPGLAAWARSQGWQPGGPDATGRQLTADAAAGDPVAISALRRAGQALGVAIASAASLCDLEVVTVGGGLSQAGTLLFTPTGEAFAAHAGMEFVRKTKIVPAALGQDAGLIGAAALISAGHRYWAGDDSATRLCSDEVAAAERGNPGRCGERSPHR